MALLSEIRVESLPQERSHLGLARESIAALSDTAAEHVGLVAEPFDGEAQFDAELGQVSAAEVAAFDVLEIVPDAFVRVEVRGVVGQGLQLQPSCRPLGEEVLDRLGTMDGRAIPDHEEVALDVAQQMLEKADDLGAPESPLAHLQEDPPVVGEAAQHGQMIARAGHAQDRRLAPRRVGAHEPRQQVEGGLVYPDDRAPLALGFACRAGQRSANQAVIACSSRWVARRIGFWTLQPISRRSRLIWAGW